MFCFQKCCYESVSPGSWGPLLTHESLASGSLLKYNPIYKPELHQKEDITIKKQCCTTGQCDLFYKLRPLATCTNYEKGNTGNKTYIFKCIAKLYRSGSVSSKKRPRLVSGTKIQGVFFQLGQIPEKVSPSVSSKRRAFSPSS